MIALPRIILLGNYYLALRTRSVFPVIGFVAVWRIFLSASVAGVELEKDCDLHVCEDRKVESEYIGAYDRDLCKSLLVAPDGRIYVLGGIPTKATSSRRAQMGGYAPTL